MTEAGRSGRRAPWGPVQWRMVCSLHGLQKHRIQDPGQLRGWSGAARATESEATVAAGLPLNPHLGENFRDWTVTPGARLPSPTLLSSVLVGEGDSSCSKNSLVLPMLVNKLDAPEKYIYIYI